MKVWLVVFVCCEQVRSEFLVCEKADSLESEINKRVLELPFVSCSKNLKFSVFLRPKESKSDFCPFLTFLFSENSRF